MKFKIPFLKKKDSKNAERKNLESQTKNWAGDDFDTSIYTDKELSDMLENISYVQDFLSQPDKSLITDPKTEFEYAIMYIQKADIESFKKIIEEQSNLVNEKNSNYYDYSLLHYVVNSDISIKDTLEIVEILFSNGADANIKDDALCTSLHDAAEYRNIEVMDLLLKNGADINSCDEDNGTPIFRALHMEEKNQVGKPYDKVQFLINNSANINVVNQAYCTSVYVAIDNFHEDIAKLLVENGAVLDNRITKSHSPLIASLESADAKMTEYLLQHGALLNVSDMVCIPEDNGMTPLHLASLWGYVEDIKVMLKYGADPTIKDKKGKTALDYAKEKGYAEIVALFMNQSKE